MIYHKLSPEDVELGIRIGKGRNEHNKKNNVVDRKVDVKKSSEQINIEGAWAEIAFARMFNIEPDLDINRPKYPDHDCILPNGLKVDVKETTYTYSPHLLIHPKKKDHPAQAYALVVVNVPECRFVGWLPAWNCFYISEGIPRPSSDKFKAIAIPKDELREPETIESAIKNAI